MKHGKKVLAMILCIATVLCVSPINCFAIKKEVNPSPYSIRSLVVDPSLATAETLHVITYDFTRNGGVVMAKMQGKKPVAVSCSPDFFLPISDDFFGIPVDDSITKSVHYTNKIVRIDRVAATGLPIKEFLGWNTDPDAKTGFMEYKMGYENITLYAIFE